MKLLNIIKNRIEEEFYAVPIGTIFSFASSNPPPGAFILNGQIIYNCQTLFPAFWNWLISESTNNNIRVVTSSTFESELSTCGNCGAFIIDTTTGSVRLPSITTGFIQGTNSNIGNSESAGLPNITGNATNLMTAYSSAINNFNAGGSISLTAIDNSGPAQSSSKQICRLSLDASNSSSIYGNSNTVQPNSVHYSFCIQVYNAASKLSTANASQILSELQGKAGINLENLSSSAKSLIQLYANELDYENIVEDNFVINTAYTSSTGGIFVAYGYAVGEAPGAFFLQTAPDVSNGYNGFQNGGNLAVGLGASLHITVPKGWQYLLGASTASVAIRIDKTRFIPFKN